ncbi:MAG: DUF971 domain-containing protein [Magnetococcales bacterium]|nr:DUF971 domain-containing protein [Magnetococcales bacterium]
MSYGSKQIPTEIRQVTSERKVVISWNNGDRFEYSMEYLRIACPCADCRGHTPSQRKLIDGKSDVTIRSITPVGHYAVKIVFSDDHDSGVYSWESLYDLGQGQQGYWQDYLEQLQVAGKRRRPSVFMIKPVAAVPQP